MSMYGKKHYNKKKKEKKNKNNPKKINKRHEVLYMYEYIGINCNTV